MRGPGGQHVTYRDANRSSEGGGAHIVDSYNSLVGLDVESRREIINQETVVQQDPDGPIQNGQLVDTFKSEERLDVAASQRNTLVAQSL